MAWVYLDDQFPDHPKVVAAGDAAAWLFVCGLAYCKRYNTAGRIPKAQVPKLTSSRGPIKLAARLADVKLWIDRGDHYAVHDYDEWNRSQQSRSDAGRKAAKARWGRDAKRNANASRTHTASDSDLPSERTTNTDASECPVPIPIPTEDLTAAEVTYDPPPQHRQQHQQPQQPRQPNISPDQERQQLIDAAARILAERRARHRPDVGPGWTRSAARGIASERRNEARTLLVNWPTGEPFPTPEQLAERLEKPPPTAPVSSPAADALDSTQKAAQARAERGNRQVREIAETPIDNQAPTRAAALRDALRHPPETAGET